MGDNKLIRVQNRSQKENGTPYLQGRKHISLRRNHKKQTSTGVAQEEDRPLSEEPDRSPFRGSVRGEMMIPHGNWVPEWPKTEQTQKERARAKDGRKSEQARRGFQTKNLPEANLRYPHKRKEVWVKSTDKLKRKETNPVEATKEMKRTTLS